MGNVSTKKDGEECGDFSQYMKSSAEGSHVERLESSGRGNPHGKRVGEGPSGVEKFEGCQQYLVFAHAKAVSVGGKREKAPRGQYHGLSILRVSGINVEEHSFMNKSEGFEQYMEFRPGASPTSMSLAPSQSLGPSFTDTILHPQPIMVPSRRLAQVGDTTENEGMLHEMWVTTQIRWSYGGKEVTAEGSWDDWKSQELMPSSGKEFSFTKVLPLGIYHFRFIVDGQWRNTPELPLVYDNTGYAYNVLNLKNYVSEDPESPSSPTSSYNNPQPVGQDFEREPPELPSQAEVTPLNGPSFSMDGSQSLTRPQTFVLNNLYIQKMNRNAVALSTTHQFRTKYVTLVLHKPCGG